MTGTLADATTQHWSGLLVFGGIALAALTLAWAVTWWVWRSPPALEPHEYAFRAIARRLRLTARQRAIFRRLARSIDADPIALLICQEAYHKALRRDEGVSEHDAHAIENLVFRKRRRLSGVIHGGSA
ncbi:MAG: hypothetical protein H6813_00600 [Phycisphaeraceae bacterium]|nr:hypothetical protein [Phycisphaeraceae bacterium]MCB9847415.1 hypothetical protein [Phycisphaeraceae bacterium]